MYIPKKNLATDRDEILSFMKTYSFATIITAKENFPIATHLPFLVTDQNGTITLTSHFAKANEQWTEIENCKTLVIFTEPHAYISPKNYEKELNVPTWNYISVHAYGDGRLITDTKSIYEALEATIDNYEIGYRRQWDNFPDEYKRKMAGGIVAFEITVTDLQAKKKLSQNRTTLEQQRIIEHLSRSHDNNDQTIAHYMQKEASSGKRP
jgi:transcriptional regulator